MASKKARRSRDQTTQRPRPVETRSAAPRASAQRWVVPLAIAAITVVVFLPVLRAGFVAYDDPENFLQNPHYRGLGWSQLRWMWTTTHLGHYVPLSWMTLGLDYVLWGMNPAGYHAVNLLLHAGNAVMLFFLARRVFRLAGIERPGDGVAAVAPAAFAALVFAVHPLRVESVAWITERRDMVALAFSLASVLWYLRSIGGADGGVKSRRWYWLAVAAFVCALLSKATAVTLPAMLLVLNVYPLRRLGGAAGWWSASARQALRELAPFGAASLLAGLGSIVALQPGAQLGAADKVAVSAYSLGFYLWKTVVPAGLAPLYERRLPTPKLSPAFLASYVVVIVFVASAWLARRRFAGLTAAFVAFGVAIFPLLGFVQNGPQIAADRYTYHAAPALALLLGAALAVFDRRALVVGAGAILGCLGFLTNRQTRAWENSETLWLRVLRFDSASYVANNNLGVVLAEQGRSDEAIARYRRSIATRPSFKFSHNNLGFELAQRGELDAAIAEYRAALAIDPAYADAEVNLGNALLQQRRFDEAVTHYAAAARIDPARAAVHFNWGLALREKGDVLGAIDHYERALMLDPDFSDARRELADARAALGPPPR
jgi:tetratricopeptide (TPR) repeat protein